MGKAKAPRRLADNEARAVLRTIRISPQKLNLVAALIRGKKVATALSDLEFSQKRISGTVRKTLESAIASPVVSTEPTQTTKMTGERQTCRGSSFTSAWGTTCRRECPPVTTCRVMTEPPRWDRVRAQGRRSARRR